MFERDQSIGEEEDLSYTGRFNNNTLLGPYTQRIPVYDLDSENVFNIWILDSMGGEACYNNSNGLSCISKEAVEWFKEESKNVKT